MTKLSVKWILRCLNADLKGIWLTTSKQDSSNFWILDHGNRFITTIQSLKSNPKSCTIYFSSTHKKFLVQKSTGKILASDFCDEGEIILLDYLEKGKGITGAYCTELLSHLYMKIAGKCHGKLTKWSCLRVVNCTAKLWWDCFWIGWHLENKIFTTNEVMPLKRDLHTNTSIFYGLRITLWTFC